MKQVISLLLTVIMIAGVLAVGVSAVPGGNLQLTQAFRYDTDTFKLGDVDGNGTITARDSLSIKAHIAGVTVDGVDFIADAADIYPDASVNSRDNYFLKAFFVGADDLTRFEQNGMYYSFTVGGADITNFVIVLPEGTEVKDNLYYCYELLCDYTEKLTGFTLPLAYGKTDSSHGIYFHEVALDSEMGEKLGYDGYIYKVENGNLHFYGAKRGNMYAVYEILEDYMGFFFCDNAFTVSEKKRCLDLAEGLYREYVTPFKYRHVLHTFWGSAFKNYYIARRLNSTTNSPSSGTETYGTYKGTRHNNAHSFYYYFAMGAGIMPEEGTLNTDGTVMTLADRYYAKYEDGRANGYIYDKVSNPSKLLENGDQPCASSTSEYEVLFEGLLDTIRMCEARGMDMFLTNGQHVMSFSINDGNTYCTCTMCTAKANGTRMKLRTAFKNELPHFSGEYTLSDDGNYVTFKKEGYAGVYLDLANRAANDIQEYYPGAHLYQIIYNEVIPESVRPSEHMVMCYCAGITGCSYHRYGDNADCTGYHTQWDNVHTTGDDEKSILAWVDMCHTAGCELWYWMYPENYTYYLFDLPVYYTVYYNMTWLYQNGVDGVYYEGTQDSGAENCFEHVRAFAAAELEWNPEMTLEEYENITKKFMKAYYGAGYEHVFRYLQYLEEAGRATHYCFTYYCPAFDAYSKTYIDEHYEEMRAEIKAAVDMSNTDTRVLCEKLLLNCELLGLSAAYDRMYTNGDAASRKTYEERYDWMYAYIKNNISKFTFDGSGLTCGLPATEDYSKSPLVQIYGYEYRGVKH